MYYRKGKKKTQVRVSFGSKVKPEYGSFDNPPREGLNDKQYEKLIEKLAKMTSVQIIKDHDAKQQLMALGAQNGEIPTFNQVGQMWLRESLAKEKHTDNTNADEQKKLERISPYIGSKKINEIKAADIDNVLVAISNEGSQAQGKKGKKLSGQTLKHYLATMRAIFNFAIKKELIEGNPAAKVDPPKVRNSGRGPINDVNLAKILEIVSENEPFMYKVLYSLLAKTGMRRGSCCALKFEDVSSDGTILVRRAIIKNKKTGQMEIKGLKAENEYVVFVDPLLASDILQLHDMYVQKKELLGKMYNLSGYIFTHEETGEPLKPNSITQHTRRLRERYGLTEGFYLHAFRHTYASSIIPQLGENAAAQTTGHRSIEGIRRYNSVVGNAAESARQIMMEKIPPKSLS